MTSNVIIIYTFPFCSYAGFDYLKVYESDQPDPSALIASLTGFGAEASNLNGACLFGLLNHHHQLSLLSGFSLRLIPDVRISNLAACVADRLLWLPQ